MQTIFKFFLLLTLIFSICYSEANAETTTRGWKAADLIVDGLTSKKQIVFGYDRELSENEILDLYTILDRNTVRGLNISRFEVVGTLPRTARRQLMPPPWYAHVILNSGLTRKFSMSSHVVGHKEEDKILNLPLFTADGSKWLLVLDRSDSEIDPLLQRLISGSKHFKAAKIFGILNGRAAFKIEEKRIGEEESVLTEMEIEELKSLHITYVNSGRIADRQIQTFKTNFAKDVASKLNSFYVAR